MRKKYIIIIVPLLVSLFIYLFYRTEKTVINDLVIQIISIKNYATLRDAVTQVLPLSKLVIYSLPGGLWVFCITLTSMPFYIAVNTRKIQCTFIPLIFSIGLEVLQLLRFTNGTFDLLDIAISILFWSLANYFFNHPVDKQNILKQVNGRSAFCFASYGIVYLSHVLK